MSGVPPSTPTDKGTTTVKKDYQKDNAAAAMAVEATMPEAVSVAGDGFYRVDYDMLGIPFRRLN